MESLVCRFDKVKECWCVHRIKALVFQVKKGLIQSDYAKVEVCKNGKWIITHEWVVNAGGVKLYCKKEH